MDAIQKEQLKTVTRRMLDDPDYFARLKEAYFGNHLTLTLLEILALETTYLEDHEIKFNIDRNVYNPPFQTEENTGLTFR